MGLAPGLSPEIERRLKEINPHFVAEWNDKQNHWEIWFHSPFKKPYLIASVVDDEGNYIPIDGRTYKHLRWLLKINKDIKRHMLDIIERDEEIDNKRDRREEELMRDIGLDMRRVYQMMGRELGITSGKAKIPYAPGWGSGTL